MADIYIATTGNDTTGDGSQGNPYLTLGKATTEASTGDTIYIEDGTYSGESFTNSGKLLTYTGVNKPSFDSYAGGWQGAIFDNADTTYAWTMNGAGSIGSAFKNMIFKNTSGTFLTSGSGNTGGQTIDNCVFIECNPGGTFSYQGAIIRYFSYIRGCAFINCGDNAGSIFGTNATDQGDWDINIYNCTFYDCNTLQTTLNGPADWAFWVQNCIFHTMAGDQIFGRAQGSYASDSKFYNNVTAGTYSVNGPTQDEQNTLVADPLFVDIANYDCRLRPNSPAIGYGATF